MKTITIGEEYTQDYRITCNDMDSEYRMTPQAILNMSQDTIAAYLTTRHIAAFDLQKEGFTWVLSEYTMEMAVPGIKKEYCRVQLTDDGNLHVAIENKMEHKDEDKKQHYLRREFSYTNYQQTYTLPDDVAKDRISAKVDNGILTVVMPKMKKEESKVARAIEIA